MTIETRREINKIALPVSLESVVQLLLGFINQVIVGTLGTATIAAVGLANNAFFIGILCLNVLGSGCAIMASKARGRGDEAEVARISSFFLVLAFGISFLVSMPLVLGGEGFLRWVGARAEIAEIGGSYMSILALSLPLITASIVMTAIFRTNGQARLPLIVTLSSLTLTPLIAWLFVSQLELGANGAAWATVLTQALRAGLLLGYLFFSRWGIRFSWPSWIQSLSILREMNPLVLPLFITEVVFSSGVFLFALLAERVGVAELAAFQIVSTIENIFIVGAVGFNSAATILVARAIGKADLKEVWHISSSVWKYGVLVAIGLGVLFGLCALLVPLLFPNTTPMVQQIALWGVLLNALFMPVKASNMIGFGILASGGDTPYLLLSDFVTVFVVGLPLAYLLAFPLGMGIWGVFLGRLLGEEAVRIAMLMWRYRQGKWFKLQTAS